MPIDKIADPNFAINAYKNMSDMISKAGSSGGDTVQSGNADGVNFSDFLENKARESVETMKGAEKMSARAVTGEADLTEVVQAVTDAELTLQTVVAVRDRMISAYQEIMRMPI